LAILLRSIHYPTAPGEVQVASVLRGQGQDHRDAQESAHPTG